MDWKGGSEFQTILYIRLRLSYLIFVRCHDQDGLTRTFRRSGDVLRTADGLELHTHPDYHFELCYYTYFFSSYMGVWDHYL